MEQDTNRLFLDGSHHCLVHLIALHLVLYHRISLAVRLKPNSLAQRIHIIQMSHPLVVNYLQQNHALDLADLLCIRILRLFCLIKLNGSLFNAVL